MSTQTNEFEIEETTGVDRRLVRAVTEKMTVVETGDAWDVHSSSGSTYTVDADGHCTCPDVEHNLDVESGDRCKHALRVEIATGERAIPAAIPGDAIDELLGCGVDTTPKRIVTDGGEQRLVGHGDDGDACDCDGLPDGVPCWPCYRADVAEFADATDH